MCMENGFSEQKMMCEMEHRYIGRDGEQRSVCEAVLAECQLSVFVNGEQRFDLVCLPQFLEELILGHLLTEGFISSAAEVTEITVSSSGTEAKVVLTHELSGKTQGLYRVKTAAWRAAWVFALADRFAQGMPLHKETSATHSCFLAKGDTILFACEDIGRHNALDKAVGYALRNEIRLEECLLYSSGRMPADMVRKAIRAGVPLLSSKGAPTADGVELARQYGLTLVCAARQDRLKLFSGVAPDGWEHL